MTTARNLLYADLTKVLAAKSDGTIRDKVLAALESYRVQLKPGAMLPHGMTAREALFNDIIETCTMTAFSEIPRRLEVVFARYRMQSKRMGAKDETIQGAVAGMSTARKSRVKKASGPTKKKQAVKMEPVGGGPVKRTKTRGECPKCHSMGVVLAHSYAGDDYFSCIYCGFQAYRAIIETDLDLPLAAELLGRRFDEKTEIDSEELENEIP